MVKAGTVVDALEAFVPLDLAADGDNSGWQVGSEQMEVAGVLVSLDVSPEVVDEALALGANLIVTHHPLLFAPLRRLDPAAFPGRLIRRLLVHDLGLYAAHTNLDVVPGGVSHSLAEALGLSAVRPLVPCPGSGREGIGWGAVGQVEAALSVDEMIQRARETLGAPQVRVTIGRPQEPDPERFDYAQDKPGRRGSQRLRTVAVCGGSGADFVTDAVRAGASLYLTGEVKYHQAQAAAEMGLTLLEVGHFHSERPVLPALARSIASRVDLPIRVSQVVTSPFDFSSR